MPRRRQHTRYGNSDDARLCRQCRDVYGWTQRELGEAMGVTQAAISQIETMERPLTYLMRKAIAQLTTFQLLQTCITYNRYVCAGQQLTDPIEYAQHLVKCAKCMAKAWVMRGLTVHP